MPTNPSWLEHTERAAWDTVKSLRQQIEQERQRSARLAPAGENWQRILDSLDGAKAEHNIEGDRYADILEGLQRELARLKAERDDLAQQLADRPHADSPAVEVIHRDPPAAAAPLGLDAGRSTGTDWFAERIAELREDQARQGRAPSTVSYERCLLALELKLEELDDASPAQATAIAIEIGSLALRVAEFGRGPRTVDDDDP